MTLFGVDRGSQAERGATQNVRQPGIRSAGCGLPPVVCFRCQQEGHIAKFCRNPRVRSKRKVSKGQFASPSASNGTPNKSSPGVPQPKLTQHTAVLGRDSRGTCDQPSQPPAAAKKGDPPKVDSPRRIPDKPSIPALEEDLLNSLSLA